MRVLFATIASLTLSLGLHVESKASVQANSPGFWGVQVFGTTDASNRVINGVFFPEERDVGEFRVGGAQQRSAFGTNIGGPNNADRFGSVTTQAEFSGSSLALPIVRSRAEVTQIINGGIISTSSLAQAAQAYTYTGSTPFDLAVDVTFNGSIEGASNVANALVAVYRDEIFSGFDPGIGSSAINVGGFGGTGGFGDNSASFRVIGGNPAAANFDFTQSFSITIDPGDIFYLTSSVGTTAQRDGFSDAFTLASELRVTSGDPDSLLNLVPASTQTNGAIPEPISLLVWAGLASVIGMQSTRRRRK